MALMLGVEEMKEGVIMKMEKAMQAVMLEAM